MKLDHSWWCLEKYIYMCLMYNTWYDICICIYRFYSFVVLMYPHPLRLWQLEGLDWVSRFPLHHGDLRWTQYIGFLVPTGYIRYILLMVQKSGVHQLRKRWFIPLKKQGFSPVQTVVGNGISEPSKVLLFQRIPPFKVLSIFGCQVSSYGQSATSGELKFCKDAGLWYWQSSTASYHPPNGGDCKGTPLQFCLNQFKFRNYGKFLPRYVDNKFQFFGFLKSEKVVFFREAKVGWWWIW